MKSQLTPLVPPAPHQARMFAAFVGKHPGGADHGPDLPSPSPGRSQSQARPPSRVSALLSQNARPGPGALDWGDPFQWKLLHPTCMPDPGLGEGAGSKAAKLKRTSLSALEKQLEVRENKS